MAKVNLLYYCSDEWFNSLESNRPIPFNKISGELQSIFQKSKESVSSLKEIFDGNSSVKVSRKCSTYDSFAWYLYCKSKAFSNQEIERYTAESLDTAMEDIEHAFEYINECIGAWRAYAVDDDSVPTEPKNIWMDHHTKIYSLKRELKSLKNEYY